MTDAITRATCLGADMLLTAAELQELTGYRQHARQLQWLRKVLRLEAPRRADGMPVVLRSQIETTMADKTVAANGPKWSKIAA